MDKIQIKILNLESVSQAEQMMVCAARLTQKGHQIKNLDDFMELYNKPYSNITVASMADLPHPTIQKFGVINIVIVGASRRFLAQITRHQNEVKFMSASCQYSDYSHEADFTVPYELINKPEAREAYISQCTKELSEYEAFIASGIDHDSAAYMLPQGLRNVLIISATPYQWKHMISQRVCRRNTVETRYVMLKIWQALYELSPVLFQPSTTGPFCIASSGICLEGKMSCGNRLQAFVPDDILKEDFPELC